MIIIVLLSACANQPPTPEELEQQEMERQNFSSPTDRKPEKVKIEFSTRDDKKLEIMGSAQSCFMRWSFFEKTIEIENYQCMLPLNDTIYIMDAMLEALIKRLKNANEISTLEFNIRNFLEIEQRLAMFAYGHTQWDSTKGIPTNPDLKTEDFLAQNAESSNMYFEITSLFARSCLEIDLLKIDQMSAFRASSLPYYPWLRRQKVKRKAMLPANYRFIFAVKPKNSFC
jgi:hypothetical protein